MFSNFIYFIIVLLIYSSYFPPEGLTIQPFETGISFFSLIMLFIVLTWLQFYRIEKQIQKNQVLYFDSKFDAILRRQSVLAILVFVIHIYGQNLPLIFSKSSLFSKVPSIQAIIFIGLFTFYLAVLWFFAFRSYQLINGSSISRKTYILSNISFSVPVLIPWFVLSLSADLIALLPFKISRQMLATTEGQAAYVFIFLIVISIIGPVMIKWFWQCKPLIRGFHRERIEYLCKKANVDYADILLWPIFGGRMITAGVLGLVKKFRYILVTSGLLNLLDPLEIDAVIAHEIGHVKHKHLLFYLFFFSGYMLISYASFNLIIYLFAFIQTMVLVSGIPILYPETWTSATIGVFYVFIFLIYFRVIFGYFMRNFERQADTYVYKLMHNARPLISTFEKIILTSGQAPDKPNWHHFSIIERIDYLKKCEEDRSWIARHDNKLKRSILVYFIGLLLIGGFGYQINSGEIGMKLVQYFADENLAFYEKILLRQSEEQPDNPDLYIHLGDLYYSNKDFSKAISIYDKALQIDPENPRALNNLAWLYATCEDKTYYLPQQALYLAKKAAQVKLAPHILDTLAESYYINGKYEQAIETQKQALELLKTEWKQSNPDNDRTHYEDQLKKFMKERTKHP